jgi:uncharacterized protein YuzE
VKVTYFSDTDTALLEFSSARVVSTREITRDVVVDLDVHGRPVSITIEHARSVDLRRATRVAGQRLPRHSRRRIKALTPGSGSGN